MRNSKDALKSWEEYSKTIQSLTPEQATNETAAEKEKRVKRLLDNYEEFVEYYFPAITRGTKSARFHIQTAKEIQKNPRAAFVLEWARGHAKSTHITLFLVLWLVMRGESKAVIIVSYNEDMAKALLGKVQAHLEKNKRLIADFGEQVSIGNWQNGEFTTRDGVYFCCRGAGQSPRGASSDNSFRPDTIVIDDLDEDQLVENPKRVRKMVKWLLSALYGTFDMGRGRFIMVGNRIHKNSILANMAKNPAFEHRVVNVLDKNGKPSWKEKYTLEEIEDVKKKQGLAYFNTEYMNNPITEGTVFKEGQIIFEASPKYEHFDDMVLYVDPSFKNTTTSDHKACVLVGKKGTQIHILKVFNRQTSISALITWLYDTYESIPEKARPLVRWYSEASFLQGDLIGAEVQEEGEKRGYELPLRQDKRQKPNKEARIESLSPLFEKGKIVWDTKIKDDSDTKTAIEHLLCFERGTRTPDDFPDALEGAIFLLHQKVIAERGNDNTRLGLRESDFLY